jgi:hypothetical protein
MKTTMKTRLGTKAFRLLCMVACLAVALPLLSQAGHPAKGSWSGDWGPTEDHRNRILLLLDWDGNEITGTINPGPNAIEIERAELDPSTWTLTIEAMVPVAGGNIEPYAATGTLENLGSWTNRTFSGTYTHGGDAGTFAVTLN